MTIVISVSHVDIIGALRQMAWIGWLSECNGNSMLNERLLLVVSRRAANYARFKQLCWLASRIFGEARCLVPEEEHEVGWPGAANWMFAQSLFHKERFFPEEDIFFLEPDGTPLVPDWFDRIQEEWVVAKLEGKSFMGAYVPHDHSHMTGIAVYGRNWRFVAPSLITCPDTDAWDTWSSKEVVPNAHFTRLIQHVFRRHDPGWVVPALAILDKQAVLFHQDKQGKLVLLLDQAYYGGRCAEHPLFSYSNLSNDQRVMRKFYYTQNATRAIVTNGRRFIFEPLECHGGSIPGTFTTDVEADVAALSEVTCNPTTGVVEITEQEWENCTKKKAPPVLATSTSKPSSGTLPQAALLPTPSKSPAVLVAEPGSGASKESAAKGPIKDIADVIKTAPVKTAQTANIGTKLPRPEKSKAFNLNREENK